MTSVALPISSSFSFGHGITLSAQVEYKPTPAPPLNLQQVGEEVEGIVMLSLLKQKLETFSESIKQSKRESEESSSDEEERYKRHNLFHATGRKRRASFGDSHPKRLRLDSQCEATRSWMDMFNMAKRNNGTLKASHSHENVRELRRTPSDLQIQEWILKQFEMKNKGLLSEERIELLKMIGIDLTDVKRFSSPKLQSPQSSGSDSDEFEEDEIRTRRGSYEKNLSMNIPNTREVSKSTISPKKVPCLSSNPKKKANLKRNSLHNWVYNQRRLESEGNLPIHRKKLLDKIDFDWKWVGGKPDSDLASNSLQSSPSGSSQEDSSLSPRNSNHSIQNLLSDNKNPLESEEILTYDIPNSKSEDLWMSRYKELIEFKAKHGNYEVPRYAE